MNKRKMIKIVSILLMVALITMTLATSVFAAGPDTTDYSDLKQFNGQSNDQDTAKVFQGFIATLINLVQVVGMAVAIIMLVVMAIKYISAAPSDKAEIKKSATVYIVGAIVLFAAAGILQVVKNFAGTNIDVSDNGKVKFNTSYVEMLDETYFG